MKYSLVIPLYNEAGTLAKLWQEINATMTNLDKPWEALFVNDGSTDNSHKVLTKLATHDRHIQVITFRRNQGKATALQTGFDAATGEIIITLDADLQDDPAEIPNLIKVLEQGFDLVSGLKKHRHDPFHKTVPSFFFNGLVRRVSGVPLHDVNCGLKAYRKEVVKHLKIYGELYRFIPILAVNEGFRVTELPVHHRPREHGQSKYGISRFMRGFLDLLTVTFLTKFLKRPLHLFGSIGLLIGFTGIIISGYFTYIHFFRGAQVGDRPLLLFGILFIISGIQLISTGLIAELINFYAHRNGSSAPIEVLPPAARNTPSAKTRQVRTR